MQDILWFSFNGLSIGLVPIKFGLTQWNTSWHSGPSLLGQKAIQLTFLTFLLDKWFAIWQQIKNENPLSCAQYSTILFP